MSDHNPRTLDFQQRTKAFAVRVIRMVESLPKKLSADVIGRQVLRSATSAAANSRAACRARSPADFRSKMGIVEEELDESLFWMELLIETGLMPASRLSSLLKESDELLSMVVASIRTSKQKSQPRCTPQKAIPHPPNPHSPIRNPQFFSHPLHHLNAQ